MSELITRALKAIRQHRETIEEQVTALESQRRDLQAERDRIQYAPIPRGDVLAAFEKTIDIWEGEFRDRVAESMLGGRRRDASENLFTSARPLDPAALANRFNLLAIDNDGTRGDMRDVSVRCLLGLLAPQLREVMRGAVNGIDVPDDGIPATERNARLAALDHEITQINERIRTLVAEAEAAGVSFG